MTFCIKFSEQTELASPTMASVFTYVKKSLEK